MIHFKNSSFAALAKRFAELPTSVRPADAKIYLSRLMAAGMGMVCHLAMVFIYIVLNVPTMAAINFGAVFVYLVAIALARSGKHYLGIGLVFVELAIHIPLATVLLGLETGYLLFNYTVAMCSPLVYGRTEVRSRILTLAYIAVSSVTTTAFMYNRPPVIVLEAWQVRVIFWVVAVSTSLVLAYFAFYFGRASDAAETRIELELARSDKLLLNVLPESIAARLKAGTQTIVDDIPTATILFADVVGFTQFAAQVPASRVVEILNNVFTAFDQISEEFGLEKIKTIGDAYMVAGGVPELDPDHAVHVVRAAVAMLDAIAELQVQDGHKLNIRIGIHTGSVVAGVIGANKFSYDLWGATVNTASRLESHGLPGQINISDTTKNLIHADFEVEDRGPIQLKGVGFERCWFVRGYRSNTAKSA